MTSSTIRIPSFASMEEYIRTILMLFVMGISMGGSEIVDVSTEQDTV